MEGLVIDKVQCAKEAYSGGQVRYVFLSPRDERN